MTRKAAREIAVHIIYNTHFSQDVSEILEERLNEEFYNRVNEEDELFESAPEEDQKSYITKVVNGVCSHLAEIDEYIEKYSVGWKISRFPLISLAIMRVVIYEILYMEDIPNSVAINEAVEISKKYQTQDITAFINGNLGSFVRNEVEK